MSYTDVRKWRKKTKRLVRFHGCAIRRFGEGRERTMSVTKVIRENREIGLTDNPRFEHAHRGDWRNYVPDEIVRLWKEMSVESRVMVYLMASHRANAKNWD